MKKFSAKDFVELAQSVYAGYPEEQAEKILKAQRELDETNIAEQQYWLTLRKLRSETSQVESTTIRVSTETKQFLNSLKKSRGESYDTVIRRLIKDMIGNMKIPDDLRRFKDISEPKDNQDG